MIEEQILAVASQNPGKTAVSYRGESYTYSKLWDEIELRKAEFLEAEISILAIQEDPLQSLITFLAAISAGISSVLLPSDYPFADKKSLQLEHGFWVSEKGSLLAPPTEHSLSKASGEIGILTSGSSGNPKIIWKTRENWVSAFPHQSQTFGISSEDRLFVLDTLAYSANQNALLHILWLGGTAVLGSLSEASQWAHKFEKNEITSVFLVPSHARLLVKDGRMNTEIRSFVTAGEKLDKETASLLLQNFPSATLTEYYGAAELGHISYHQNEHILENPLSVGVPFPGVKLNVEDGLIRVQSDYISPDFRVVGTVNDLGEWRNGRLLLMGRNGRMFNRRGLNIFAAEIENKALECGLIVEAALVPILNSNREERLYLYVVGKPEVSDLHDRISAYLLEKLPKAKLPNKIIVVDELPHSESGKVDFRALSKVNEWSQETA